jgi:hypothetical protein
VRRVRHRRPFDLASALALCGALAGLTVGCGDSSNPAAVTTRSTGAGTTPAASAARVAPRGGAYSYTVPAGFKLAPGTGPGQHLTTLASTSLPAGSGTLSAFEFTPGADLTDAHAADRFLAAFDRQTVAFYRGRGGTLAAGTRTTIAGHPAMCWRISHFKTTVGAGVVDADACAIVAGGVIVQQGCNWKPSARVTIERGCEALRASLKVSS